LFRTYENMGFLRKRPYHTAVVDSQRFGFKILVILVPIKHSHFILHGLAVVVKLNFLSEIVELLISRVTDLGRLDRQACP
jgi:hypothetical protein